jgi:phosphoglycolate phosphatase-like HAD superfamily hydrolase
VWGPIATGVRLSQSCRWRVRASDGWTDAGDVERTKPEPDLIIAALQKAGAKPDGAVMIGDSVWDCRAADRAGVRSLGVLTGGFFESELLEAGASGVFDSVEALREHLADTPLRV